MVSWQQINVFFILKLESLFGEITRFDSCLWAVLCLGREEVCAGSFGWLVFVATICSSVRVIALYFVGLQTQKTIQRVHVLCWKTVRAAAEHLLGDKKYPWLK